jgi:hypothetical protein
MLDAKGERYFAQEIAYWMMLAGLFLQDGRKEEARKCLLEVNRLGTERDNQRQSKSEAADFVPQSSLGGQILPN